MKSRIVLLLLLVSTFAAAPVSLSAQTSGRSAALKTIGAQGGALLYNTYCLIGAMHDGYIYDTWKKDMVMDILEEQMNLMTNVSSQYDELLASGYLDEEDSVYVSRMKECCGLLKDEAKYLKYYVDDGTAESKESYDDARDAAWKMIEDLLDLKSDDYSGNAGRAKAKTENH